ncbi:MAG: AbrB/MazE/SpoVT family DNA-binding domain-containing protein [Candidatus Binatia bacterium]
MAVTKLWGRGQLTIPVALRKELHLDKEATLNVVKVGAMLLLTPKKLIGDRVAQAAQKEMKKIGLTLEDLLKDLEKQRERYNRKRYGR